MYTFSTTIETIGSDSEPHTSPLVLRTVTPEGMADLVAEAFEQHPECDERNRAHRRQVTALLAEIYEGMIDLGDTRTATFTHGDQRLTFTVGRQVSVGMDQVLDNAPALV